MTPFMSAHPIHYAFTTFTDLRLGRAAWVPAGGPRDARTAPLGTA